MAGTYLAFDDDSSDPSPLEDCSQPPYPMEVEEGGGAQLGGLL